MASELPKQWAWEDLNLRPHPETKIARGATGSAAREPSLAGPPDSHPSWRPRPWGSYQQSRAERCADRRFPRSFASVWGRRDAFLATPHGGLCREEPVERISEALGALHLRGMPAPRQLD